MSLLRRLLTAGCLAAGACALTVAAAPEPGYTQPPEKKDKDDKGPKKKDKDGPGPKDRGPKDKDGPRHVADLRAAHGLLTEVAALARPEGKGKDRDEPRPKKDKKDGPAGDERRLAEAARKLYRDAVAANADDGPPNPELAAAAHDAARGLHHWALAHLPPAPGLPAPPAGPEPGEGVRAELRRVRDRLEEPGEAAGSAGKEFREAARRAVDLARGAVDDKEYDRAAHLARAAEAWSHVGEHLSRKDEPAPPPKDRKDRDRPESKGKKDRDPPPPPTK